MYATMSNSEKERAFRMSWKEIAACGGCDAPYGMEYQRVIFEWRCAGRPNPDSFIVFNANFCPASPAIASHSAEQTNGGDA